MQQQIVSIGVLALQGGFQMHLEAIERCQPYFEDCQVRASAVRTPSELAKCDALIIPGGESTTIVLLAQKAGLLEPLKKWVKIDKRPTYGTCAGMILLAEESIEPNKEQKQATIGGVDLCVVRNQWGRQLASFEHPLQIQGIREPETPFQAIFIRAPVAHHRMQPSKGAPTEQVVLSEVPRDILPVAKAPTSMPLGPDASIVALKQGNCLVTSFHPELGTDSRVHELWIRDWVIPSIEKRP